jgi:hypothetical protein
VERLIKSRRRRRSTEPSRITYRHPYPRMSSWKSKVNSQLTCAASGLHMRPLSASYTSPVSHISLHTPNPRQDLHTPPVTRLQVGVHFVYRSASQHVDYSKTTRLCSSPAARSVRCSRKLYRTPSFPLRHSRCTTIQMIAHGANSHQI